MFSCRFAKKLENIELITIHPPPRQQKLNDKDPALDRMPNPKSDK